MEKRSLDRGNGVAARSRLNARLLISQRRAIVQLHERKIHSGGGRGSAVSNYKYDASSRASFRATSHGGSRKHHANA